MASIRIRGITATALTALFADTEHAVVDPSPPIRNRFDRSFVNDEPDLSISDSADRCGLAIDGDSATIEHVLDILTDLAPDALAYTASLPRNAVVAGTVSEEVPGGYVVAVDDALDTFLPTSRTDRSLDIDDHVSGSIVEPMPPWSRDRPVLTTTFTAWTDYVELTRGKRTARSHALDPEDAQALDRSVALHGVSVPDGWKTNWSPTALELSIDARASALKQAATLTTPIETAIAACEGSDPGIYAMPTTSRWVWLGREATFALDDQRATVTPTLTGHHRLKRLGDPPSSAVDFTEALGQSIHGYPQAAAMTTFGPAVDDSVSLVHGKPGGNWIRLGSATVVDCDPETGEITIEREMTGEGSYDALKTEKEPGDIARTRIREGRWWYVTAYRGADGTKKGLYGNICTPVFVDPGAVRYVDLFIDVIKRPSEPPQIVDEAELDAATTETVDPALAQRAKSIAEKLCDGLA